MIFWKQSLERNYFDHLIIIFLDAGIRQYYIMVK
jgi:hypothetical protein